MCYARDARIFISPTERFSSISSACEASPLRPKSKYSQKYLSYVHIQAQGRKNIIINFKLIPMFTTDYHLGVMYKIAAKDNADDRTVNQLIKVLPSRERIDPAKSYPNPKNYVQVCKI